MKLTRWLNLWGPVIAWCGVIFYLSHVPHLRITAAWWDFPLRKLAHMTEYGILAYLIERALKGSFAVSPRALFLTAWVLALLYAASDELHQHFVVGRHASPIDVLIDAAGAGIALILRAGLKRPRI
jgi:VanZ family protein